MNRSHATQFTLAGLLTLMLLVCLVMAGCYHFGAIAFATFIEVIPYCLLAMASMVFFDGLRSGPLRWVLVTSATVFLLTVVHCATYRGKVWSGVVEEDLELALALLPHLTDPFAFGAFLVFGVSLLLTAFRIRHELSK